MKVAAVRLAVVIVDLVVEGKAVVAGSVEGELAAAAVAEVLVAAEA